MHLFRLQSSRFHISDNIALPSSVMHTVKEQGARLPDMVITDHGLQGKDAFFLELERDRSHPRRVHILLLKLHSSPLRMEPD
jgi:rRNA pseudouridine-1189 N-methylase Emg1 (Nep1/Mra1 family)